MLAIEGCVLVHARAVAAQAPGLQGMREPALKHLAASAAPVVAVAAAGQRSASPMSLLAAQALGARLEGTTSQPNLHPASMLCILQGMTTRKAQRSAARRIVADLENSDPASQLVALRRHYLEADADAQSYKSKFFIATVLALLAAGAAVAEGISGWRSARVTTEITKSEAYLRASDALMMRYEASGETAKAEEVRQETLEYLETTRSRILDLVLRSRPAPEKASGSLTRLPPNSHTAGPDLSFPDNRRSVERTTADLEGSAASSASSEALLLGTGALPERYPLPVGACGGCETSVWPSSAAEEKGWSISGMTAVQNGTSFPVEDGTEWYCAATAGVGSVTFYISGPPNTDYKLGYSIGPIKYALHPDRRTNREGRDSHEIRKYVGCGSTVVFWASGPNGEAYWQQLVSSAPAARTPD